jgi:uncharacterized protein YraI
MLKRFVNPLLASAAVLSIMPGAAFAQSQAVTNAPVVVYAGPGADYPVVTQLPGGVPVTVMGCVEGYTWCDIAAPDLRGWAYGGSLSYPYQGANVPVMNYGTVIGLPIVTFAIGSYWGSYYRNRPWYHDEPRWEHHAPPPHANVPPPQHGGPPPQHGGPPPQHGGPPPQHGGPPPQHGGPPAEHGGPPPQHGGPPAEHGGPPPQHGGPPAGPPPAHSGGPGPAGHGGEGGHGGETEHQH